MTKPLINEDYLRKFFVNPDKKSYGKISQRELNTKYFNMDKDLAESLNSQECYQVSPTEEHCLGRLDNQEVDQYLKKHPGEGLANLFILQDLELNVGAPIFTPAATELIAKRFADKMGRLYANKDLQDIRREIQYDPEQKKKVFVTKFSYLGQSMELLGGGVRFQTQVWDPHCGESGAMEDLDIKYYHSDFLVGGGGSELLTDPMAAARFIPVLDQGMESVRALEKLYDEGKYQLEKQSRDADGITRDLPIMVLHFDENSVIVEARRFASDEDEAVVDVRLKVRLDRLDQENFYSEMED